MVQRYKLKDVSEYPYDPYNDLVESDEGEWVGYEDYKELEANLNDILDMLVKLDNDLGYGLIPDEYAYDRVGEILERYRNVSCN